MPFIFIIVGVVFITAGVRGTSSQLLTLLEGDITGKNNFAFWILSILVIGAIGYIEDLRSLSRAFLVLVILGLILNEDKNGAGGFFQNFQAAVNSITKGGA